MRRGPAARLVRADDAGELAQQVGEEAEDLDLRILQIEQQHLPPLVLHRLQQRPCASMQRES